MRVYADVFHTRIVIVVVFSSNGIADHDPITAMHEIGEQATLQAVFLGQIVVLPIEQLAIGTLSSRLVRWVAEGR